MRIDKSSNDMGLTIGAVAALLLMLVLSIESTAAARARDGTPSEREARWPMHMGERFQEDQVIIRSLKTQEDRLYVNDELFVLTDQTSIVDERGRRLRPGSLWVGWLVELRYRTGKRSELRAFGPVEKVLVQMRVLERLPNSAEDDP